MRKHVAILPSAFGLLLLMTMLINCHDHGTNPPPDPAPDTLSNPTLVEDIILCYQKVMTGHWKILTSGTGSFNISLASNILDDQDDLYPRWSPDGRYVAFQRSEPVFGPSVHVYDFRNGTDTILTSDGGIAASPPNWTSDGKVFFAYQRPLGSSTATYLMNPDGSGKKKILEFAADIYFYRNSYTFVYRKSTYWYRSNVDNTVDQLILDSTPTSDQFVTVRDFNPINDEFLVNTNAIPGSTSSIAVFNIDSQQLKSLSSADLGFTVSLARFSPDYSKVVFVETASDVEYLSVLDNSVMKRLLRLGPSEPRSRISYVPMQFSRDGRYVAFSIMKFGSGGYVSWVDQLWVVDILTRGLQYIDEGTFPSWKPLK